MLGWHLIISTYGFWLPNEERGSGSVRVRAQHLYDVGGEATKVRATRSVAGKPFDRERRRIARGALKYPPLELTGLQARAVGRGIAKICLKVDLTVHACAILPDHVHAVVAVHQLDGDELIACLKRAGTRGMNDEGLHPLAAFRRKGGRLPSPWGAKGWHVMLFSPVRMRAAIKYVESNPERAGLRRQRWGFVVPYLG
jgi:REP element-mobilizing transposase RayT